MDDFNFTVIDGENNFKLLESLRFDSYGIHNIDFNQYYYDKFIHHKILLYGAFYHGVLVGGAYISSSFDSLFVEQLFVKKEFQKSYLHVGSKLLNYIIYDKKYCEEFFKTKFDVSRLESRNNDLFYQKLGYQKEDNIYGTMKKRI